MHSTLFFVACRAIGTHMCSITGIICFLYFIPGIVLGSISAADYVRNRPAYTNTSCRLLHYSFFTHTCQTKEEYPSEYTCFNEQFLVTYSISNGTILNNTFSSDDNEQQHSQVSIGSHYPCFYQQENVATVKWDRPDWKTPLIRLCIFFGIFGLLFVMMILSVTCIIIGSSCGKKSCASNPIKFADRQSTTQPNPSETNPHITGYNPTILFS
ncbi:unnamed protein product [Adineta ricciae]|uniref:Uncharacterized protein n=1 Tax=Adineta ricciae TaxID=249248 RepID=A0A814QLB7_ADIRI|nr:unnamed protein product [Adineta ricciae]CAF1355287.1 unnamed protein product [Adineta ricciae]